MDKFFLFAFSLLLIQGVEAAQKIQPEERAQVQGHTGGIFWLTGLSGAGKTTTARNAERQLFLEGARVIVLDGDVLRGGLNSDLAFSAKDRQENVRRVRELAKVLSDSGMIVICSLISPYAEDRKLVQNLEKGNLVYIEADLDTCMQRDPKGLYKKAVAGEIKQFTGISAPYEVPENPDLVITTSSLTPDESATKLIEFIKLKTKV